MSVNACIPNRAGLYVRAAALLQLAAGCAEIENSDRAPEALASITAAVEEDLDLATLLPGQLIPDKVADAGAPDPSWTYYEMPGTRCRDGSPAGVTVQKTSSLSRKLMIYFEGGSACFSDLSCSTNPSTLDPNGGDRRNIRVPEGEGGDAGVDDPRGLFNRSDPRNPVRDWNFVYIPYCTGDLHLGTRIGDVPDASADSGLTAQTFVGRKNLELLLESIVPSFPNLERLLIAGRSAGGGATSGNAVAIRNAFRDHATAPQQPPISVLVDAAPSLSSSHELPNTSGPRGDYLPQCAQDRWTTLWGLEDSLIADCGPACIDSAGRPVPNVLAASARALPARLSRKPALVMGKEDVTLSALFVLAHLVCESPDQALRFDMRPALDDFRARMQGQWLTYYVTGSSVNLGQPKLGWSPTQHTWTEADNLYSVVERAAASSSQVRLIDWVSNYIAGGEPADVGPRP